MDEVTTRRRTPPPSNTRKLVEADARSMDLLPESSTSHARRPSMNVLQLPEEPEFIPHDLAGPYPVQNSPSTPQNAVFGPFCASRESFVPLPPPTRRAGRKKSRTNTPPHPSNVPSPNSACNSKTQVTQHDERTRTSTILAGNCMRISVRAPRLAAFMTPTCRRERTRPQHRNKTLPTTRLLRLTAKKFAQHAKKR